ncbi:MAG: two-component regulator propeller domain-containing protein [bacterium]
MKLTVIILLTLLEANYLLSQNCNYKFDRYTTNDGLSSNTITCLIKDKEGFIWIGTIDGLHRFDGISFKIYHPESGNQTSISDSWINEICEEGNYLWVGTPNGLNRLDKATGKFTRYRNDPAEISSISNDYVTSIYRTRKNEIWIGTEDGLNLFDQTTGKVKRYNINNTPALGSNFIKALFEDKEGYLWIGTYGGGLTRYNDKNNEFKNYRFDQDNPFSISSDFTESIIEDSTGNLWIATNGGGVNRFDKKKELFYRYMHDPEIPNSISGNHVKTLSLSSDQMIWSGIQQEGVSIFDPVNNTFANLENCREQESSIDNVSKIYTDDKGSIWICTSKGVYTYNKHKWKFSHYLNIQGDSNSLNDNEVISICNDLYGNVWVATKTGLQILNKSTGIFSGRITKFNDSHNFGNNIVQYIFRDKKNYMWLSFNSGPLIRSDPVTGTITSFYDFDGAGIVSRCIFEDKEENLWVGSWTGGGITVFDKNRNLKKKYLDTGNDIAGFSSSPVYQIYEDSKRNIWIATFEGLIMIEPGTDRVITFKNDPENPNTLSDNRVTGIVEDKEGFLWISTYGEGLNKFDPATKSFIHYIEDWLGADIIVEILQDDTGNLWLSNFKGISRFNPDNETFTNYGAGDGVQGLEFSIGASYKAEDGKMYFGGINGFNSFYPDSISENKSIPNIVITSFKIFNKEVNLEKSITETNEITISHKENFFSFDFASLDYTNPVKNQYAYILEGVDKDWNYVGKVRTANYTDIAPGEYTFRVKGSNNNGVWNEEGTSLKLTITPPFYKTIWFKGLSVLFVAGVIGFIFRQKLKRIEAEKKTQVEFSKKLMRSQENDRKRVAAELHDSLAQHLLIIKSKAKIIFKKTGDEKIKTQLNEISELSSTTLDEIRKISYNLRPYELDRLGLSKTLLSVFENVNESTNIKFDIEVDDIDKMLEDEIEINIYRIIQEILNNIIKHSQATEVTGSITYSEEEILISILDNGKGFYVEKKLSDSEERAFGLKGIYERVKLFGGTVDIDSKPDKGTQIKICIPFKK